jgi:NADP-dependent 3-hydroxy acid dehydrogenase YdfG
MKQLSLKGQTALITGASSGIGKACAEQFAEIGVNLIITARRFDRLNELAQTLTKQHGVRVTPYQLDVRDNGVVEAVFKQIEQAELDIDIVVNNAGLALSSDKLQDGKTENWDTMIDTNLKGLLYVTKAALPFLLKKNKGHVINIGSVAGLGYYTAGNVYCATKHAVNAISHTLRMDLAGKAIRVSEIDPGAVETEFSEVRWSDKERAKKMYEGFHPLVGADIADAVIYCATRPEHVNVSQMVVYPQAQSALTDINRTGDQPKSIFDVTKNRKDFLCLDGF